MPALDEMPTVVVPPIEHAPRSAPRPLSRPEDDLEPPAPLEEPPDEEGLAEEPPAALEVEDTVVSTPAEVQELPDLSAAVPVDVELASMPEEPALQAEDEASVPSGTGAEEWIETLEAEARAEAETRRLHRVPDELPREVAEPEPGPETSSERPTVVLIHEEQRAHDRARDEQDDVDAPIREAVGDPSKKRRGLFRRGGD